MCSKHLRGRQRSNGLSSSSHRQDSDSCSKKRICIHSWFKMVFVSSAAHMCEQRMCLRITHPDVQTESRIHKIVFYIFFKAFLCFPCLQYSLCNEPLIELSNPGASGSVFYVTKDDEFIIKTVMHKEAEFLQKLLPGYYMVSVCWVPNAMWVLDA